MYMSPNANRMHDVMNLRTKKGWRLLGKMIWRYKWIYLIMLLPGLALTIVFRYLPLPGILLAFKTYKPLFGDSSLYGFLGASPWVGMDQFMRVFSEPAFWTATRNTVVISLLKLLVGFPFPIVLAILLSEMTGKRYKRVLQTVYTFPHFLSWVVLAGIMLNLFGDTGALKKIAMLFDPDVASGWNILYNTRTFRTMLILSDVWKEGGWGTDPLPCRDHGHRPEPERGGDHRRRESVPEDLAHHAARHPEPDRHPIHPGGGRHDERKL